MAIRSRDMQTLENTSFIKPDASDSRWLIAVSAARYLPAFSSLVLRCLAINGNSPVVFVKFENAGGNGV